MSAHQPANPAYGLGQTVAVATTSTAFTLAAPSKQVIVTNTGANPIYVRITPAGGAATTADMIVLPSQQVILTKFADTLAGAMIATGGASTAHIIPAEGFTIS